MVDQRRPPWLHVDRAVVRNALLGSINRSPSAARIVVSAPCGTGKSTLLEQVHGGIPGSVLITTGDGDRFSVSVHKARRHGLIETPRHIGIDELHGLAAQLSATSKMVIIDDADLLADATGGGGVLEQFTRSPNRRILLAGRSMQRFQTDADRWIDELDLRFTVDEITELALLEGRRDIAEDPFSCYQHTGGWPVGVRWMFATTDIGNEVVATPTIVDYLRSESFAMVADADLDVLSEIGVIGSATADAIDAARRAANSLVVFGRHSHRTVPLLDLNETPLHQLTVWPLLADVLSARLAHRDPRWWSSLVDAAVDHAAGVGDLERAYRLLCRHADIDRRIDFVYLHAARLAFDGHHQSTLVRWLSEYTSRDVQRRPVLAVCHLMLCLVDYSPHEIPYWCRLADAPDSCPPPPGHPTAQAVAEWTRNFFNPSTSHLSVAPAHPTGVWDLLQAIGVFNDHLWHGRFDEAEYTIERARPAARGYEFFDVAFVAALAFLHHSGDHADADQSLRAASARLRVSPYYQQTLQYQFDAVVAIDAMNHHDVDQARVALGSALRKIERCLPLPEARLTAVASSLLPVAAWLGSAHDIERLLAAIRANRVAVEPYPYLLQRSLSAVDHAAQAPSLSVHLTPTERQILASLDSPMPLPKIAAKHFVSVSTARTHVKSIYRKLGAHSRADAVEVARALGLVERHR